MHIEIFSRRFPTEYANRGSLTIDHRDTNKRNLRSSNLRLANSSNQNQNRNRRERIIPYTGVVFNNEKFIGRYKNQTKHTDTMEEAAAEYNRLALLENSEAKVNIINSENTHVIDILGADKLKDIIDEIETVAEINSIIYVNNWIEEFGLQGVVRKDEIDYYLQKIRNKLESLNLL